MFRQIHTSLWREAWFIALPSAAKLVFLFLITNDYIQPSGFVPLTLEAIANETCLTSEEVARVLVNLDSKVIYFPAWGFWVKRFPKWQGKGAKWKQAIRTNLLRLPTVVSKAFLSEYPDTPSDTPSDTLSDTPSDTPSDTLSSPVSSKQETVNSEKGEEKREQGAVKKPSASILPEDIETLRKDFPDIDLDEQLKLFDDYWSEETRQLKKPKLALRKWLMKAREIKKEGHDGKARRGAQKGATSAELRASVGKPLR